MAKQDIQHIKVNDLRLWTENPRDPVDFKGKDFDVIKRAIDENPQEWNLDKLVKEMGDHYDFSEIPTVVFIEGVPVVFDGNRRVAVLKYLQDQELFSILSGKLFLGDGPQELRELTQIPCNVCDRDTALTNIERKHVSSGSWGAIQREYFLHHHRGQPKSLFLLLDEQTGMISASPALNQGFVKEEVLNEKNLKDLGFGIDNDQLVSAYETEEEEKDVLEKIGSLVEDKDITTRRNRGQLKQTFLEKFPENKGKIPQLKDDAQKRKVTATFEPATPSTPRRTPVTSASDELFGRKLILKTGPVNDLYCGIIEIYEKYKDKEHVQPIIGMTLRLILDVAGRVYYEQKGVTVSQDDQISKTFVKDAKKALKAEWAQKKTNTTSLTADWISDKYSLEAVLHKYAHGNIDYSKQTIVQISKIVGDILEHHFKK